MRTHTTQCKLLTTYDFLVGKVEPPCSSPSLVYNCSILLLLRW